MRRLIKNSFGMDKKERVSALFFVFCAMIHSETDGEMPEPGGIRAVCGEVKALFIGGDGAENSVRGGNHGMYRSGHIGGLLKEIPAGGAGDAAGRV